MKKQLSQTKKKLLYVLIGSSFFWQVPYAVHGAENTVPSGQDAEKQQTFTLEEIVVTANRDQAASPAYAGGQVTRSGNLGILGNKDFMDTPFNFTGYTAQTIENQQARTLYDVLLYDPSVRFSNPDGQMRESFLIRGFAVTAEELSFNGLYGLGPRDHTSVEFLERVEVLKGPSALLNGMSPKRAGDQPLTQLTTDYTSSSHWGGHIDIGRRFGENHKFGLRFNGVYRDGKTGVEDVSQKRTLGSVGLDYRDQRCLVSLDAYDNKDNGSPSAYSFASGVVSAPDAKTNLMRGTWVESNNKAILLKTEYALQDNLAIYAGIGKQNYTYAGFYAANMGLLSTARGMYG